MSVFRSNGPEAFDSSEWGFKRADIYDFLEKHGLSLNRGKSGSSGDADSKQEIERLKSGDSRLTADLPGVAPDRDSPPEQVSALSERVSELSGLLDVANARIQELSSDQAQGKSRTMMLQVIGGLVMANTDMDIHASRLDGLAKLRTDLQTVGVTIGEDALRSYLKEAAASIPKPASR